MHSVKAAKVQVCFNTSLITCYTSLDFCRPEVALGCLVLIRVYFVFIHRMLSSRAFVYPGLPSFVVFSLVLTVDTSLGI